MIILKVLLGVLMHKQKVLSMFSWKLSALLCILASNLPIAWQELEAASMYLVEYNSGNLCEKI